MSISAVHYQPIYYFTLLFLTIAFGFRYSLYTEKRILMPKQENPLPSFMLCVACILFIGFRPISLVFVDMAGYASSMFLWEIPNSDYSWSHLNLIFDNFRVFFASNHFDIKWFFLIIAFVYYGAMWQACRKLFPFDTFFAFVVTLSAFSCFSYGTNGIKAGAATSVFLLALAYNKHTWQAILLALISWGLHHSMSMVVGAFIIAKLYNKPKFYVYFWLVSLGIAALHITFFQSVFQSFADEQGAEYLSEQQYGKGFRADFILYSAVPVIVGYYAIFYKKIKSVNFNFIYNCYLLTNAIWVLCMYAEFTNRIAYLSWFMYPIVLLYPFLNIKMGKNQYKSAIFVAFLHLGFTLFMSFIYY